MDKVEAMSTFSRLARTHFLANALRDSIQDSDLKAVKYLVSSRHADANYFLEDLGVTPLHIAAGAGDEDTSLEMVKVCIANGGNPNVRCSEGMTPLHVAAVWGRRRVLQFLIEAGGDPNQIDSDGYSAFDYLIESVTASKDIGLISNNSLSIGRPTELPVRTTSDEKAAFGERSSLAAYNDSARSEFNKAFLTEDSSSLDFTLCIDQFLPVESQSEQSFVSCSTPSDLPLEAKESSIPSMPIDVVDSTDNSSSSAWMYTHQQTNQLNSRNGSRPRLDQLPWLPTGALLTAGDSAKPSSTGETPHQPGDISGGSYSSCPTERLKYLLHENNLVHGPILKSTKRVYLYQLKKLKQGRPCGILNNVPLDYNDVILATMNGKLLSCIEKWTPLEALLVDQIRNAALAGNKFDSTKQYFTYLLLDPSATKKISNYRLNETDLCSSWESFLKSVFYIGKGKNSRPLDHLLDAMKHDKSSPSEKIAKIKDIWSRGLGVICVTVFKNIPELEALTREACMINALSIGKLTNVVSGNTMHLQGWSLKSKRQLGVVLLYRAMMTLIAEGERQIFPNDLQKLVR
ncbi:LEM domain [Nesidiocoris tenuis]|uniref:LEM domain n=1 Tax=Nesidiocoris tenuis TaxID=355587 RepID=A0ABN7AIX4_9HEMI|nr:LEM domain [Nesidiocoris tenuis]